jgi:hypothetical protein
VKLGKQFVRDRGVGWWDIQKSSEDRTMESHQLSFLLSLEIGEVHNESVTQVLVSFHVDSYTGAT